MNVFFTVNQPSILKVGEVIIQLKNNTVVLDSEDLNDKLLEFVSLDSSKEPCRIFFNETFLNEPPENVTVNKLYGAFAVSVHYNVGFMAKIEPSFQKAVSVGGERTLVTVLLDGYKKLIIESRNDVFMQAVNFCFDSIEADSIRNSPNCFYVSFIGEKKLLMIFCLNEKWKVVYKNIVDKFVFDDNLKTVERGFGHLGYEIETLWKQKGTEFLAIKRDVRRIKELSPNTDDRIIPYCFFEELAIDGAFSDYLADGLIPESAKLKDYLGDYIEVFSPPHIPDPKVIGLKYRCGQKNNSFYSKYFIATVENKKITNLIPYNG